MPYALSHCPLSGFNLAVNQEVHHKPLKFYSRAKRPNLLFVLNLQGPTLGVDCEIDETHVAFGLAFSVLE